MVLIQSSGAILEVAFDPLRNCPAAARFALIAAADAVGGGNPTAAAKKKF